VAVDDDQGGAVVGLVEDAEGAFEHFEVVGVADTGDVPAVGDEAGGDVVAEREGGLAFDGDAIVVVDPAEVVELEVTGEAGGLGGCAFHHATVAADRVDVVVEHLEAGRL
jgi:hypothetical protein